ncbi:MAG: hypothetical protein VB100_14255 [Angelakisella sp.]|nr:hypothetical protein [Angelakisella sp.]
MVTNYGELVRLAREQHSPPMTAKQLAEMLKVKAPFITDIEKGRRLPSLQNQNKIKKLLACEQFPNYMFDDLAAADNEDPRIVAEDIAKDIRRKSALRDLIRAIHTQKLSAAQIAALTATIGGNENGK